MGNSVRGQEELTQSLSSATSMTMVPSETWPLIGSLYSHNSISPINQRISHLLFKPSLICMESICGSEKQRCTLFLSLPYPISFLPPKSAISPQLHPPATFNLHLHRSYLSSLHPITLAAKSTSMESELFASTSQQLSRIPEVSLLSQHTLCSCLTDPVPPLIP